MGVLMERYIFNECVYLGANARACLPEELRKRKFKKVLLVTDDVIIRLVNQILKFN